VSIGGGGDWGKGELDAMMKKGKYLSSLKKNEKSPLRKIRESGKKGFEDQKKENLRLSWDCSK